MRSSTFLRRFGAALSMAFLVDLGGQASATLCAAAGVVASHPPVAHAVGAIHATVGQPALRQVDLARDDCSIPAGARGCATMTICAWPTAEVASPLAALPFAHATFEPAESALLRSGPATAPEPPPPRG